ncbi:hypothetical protein BJ508DRAFT_362753 [Ascobolus immersus RN42]|uniref:Uncharacterized protein n=1 Tax=Ascobolus immersus RN42 TaxID=1160509 RepID=A0A3N4I238_ASCIM|nr:hypothetical protein BJ508DRAFT_362753 [Ascobolus immersus RN42]
MFPILALSLVLPFLSILPLTTAYYGFNHHPNDQRLTDMYRERVKNRHSDGQDSQWEAPHPSGLFPTGPGCLDSPEIQAFLNSKYQCRRFEWAPKPEDCRGLLEQLPKEIGCGDKRMVFRSEDRASAEGGGGVGGCEISIFDSDPTKGTCWSRADIVKIVEGMIDKCTYDDDYGTTHPALMVMGSYWDTMEFTDEVRWKVLTVQPTGVKLFNEDRFWTFPKNGGVYMPDMEDVLVVAADSAVIDVSTGLEAVAAEAAVPGGADVTDELDLQIAVPAFGDEPKAPVVVGTLSVVGGSVPTRVVEKASRIASVAASKVSKFVETVKPTAWGGVVVVTGAGGVKEAQATHVDWKLTDELNVFMGEPVVEEPLWTAEPVARQGILEGYH